MTAVGQFLDQLIQRGLLHQGDEDEYFVVRVTRVGREAWQSGAASGFELPRAGVRSGGSGGRGGGEAAELSAESAGLFQNLRVWRRQQAGQDGVPPYLILSDKVLMEIAAVQPANLDELHRVSGIGEAKLERYGQAVLRVLQAGGTVDE